MTRHPWSSQEDALLEHIVKHSPQPIQWSRISKCFRNRTPTGCKSRWITIHPEPFTKDDDARILDFMSRYPHQWNNCAKILKTRRTQLMIQDRWTKLQEEIALEVLCAGFEPKI